MKNHFLIMCLAAALLVGCSKEPETLNDNSPVTHIIAKAAGDAEVSLDTKAPIDGSSFNGKTADVYTASEDLNAPVDGKKMFTDVYARGTMTFDATNYVGYNTTDFGGLNGGSKLLPTDGSELYVYGFYPAGWVRIAGTSYESLTYVFDGHHDVMSTWLTAADNAKVAYMNPSVPEQANLTFKHLLTRFNIQIKAADADVATAWGRVKSVAIKETTVTNRVTFSKKFGATLGAHYDNDGTTLTPTSFFKLTGAADAPTYSDDKFAATDYATAFELSQSYENACYSLVAPVAVDATTAEELTLVVTTITADAKEIQTELPVSFDQSKFTDNGNSTRGFSITLALNFRSGVVQATAIVEPWMDYGIQYEGVDMPDSGSGYPSCRIGDAMDGGVVFWVDPNGEKTYKVVSVVDFSGAWSSSGVHVVGAGAQSDTNGRMNDEAIKAYYNSIKDAADFESTFHTVFPASGFCYNYPGRDSTDVKGTWYLPAKAELQYLWCAYNGQDPISWASGTNAAAPADATAQGQFNQYLIDAGGTSMARDQYDSSTENSSHTNEFWYMSFANSGETLSISKIQGSGVRCVKTVTRASFKVGDLKDGGIVYWIDHLDPSNYKVFSLKQPATTLTACPLPRFMYCAQDGETDGRKNIAKMKTYSATDASASHNFAVDYPAAHYCDTYGSDPVGIWHLPSKSELEEFSKIYALKKPDLDWDIASNGGDAITTTTGSRYLTSSSEHDSSAALYVVDLANNVTSTDYRHPVAGMVRCIRNSGMVVSPPVIGELRNGGIIYEVTDATNYKVVSLTETTGSVGWAKGRSGYDVAACKGSLDDGKANTAAIIANSTGNVGSATGVLATDYPATNFCVTLGADWYLPAQNELQALGAAVRGNQSVRDALTTNSGTPFSGGYWSSSMDSYDCAFYYDFDNDQFTDDMLDYPMAKSRCIKRSN